MKYYNSFVNQIILCNQGGGKMKVHELGIPRLETTMARLLQRPDEMQVEDVRDLLDSALGCLKRGDLLLSNTVVVAIAHSIDKQATLGSLRALAGYAEILEEVFGG